MISQPLKRCPLPGVRNCRDMGGHPLPGGRTRWGVIYRSAAPTVPPAPEELRKLGIGLIIDLRSSCERGPSFPEGGGIRRVRIPLLEPLGEGADRLPPAQLYPLILRRCRGPLAEVFTAMARCPEAVLFHGAGGEHRTGTVAALLLQLAGAAAIDIRADHAVSRLLTAPEAAPAVSDPGAMAALLGELEARGGAGSLLLDCGVTSEDLARLRERLTEVCAPTAGGFRRIPLGRMENFRDLGGILCGEGSTRWGRFYRFAFPSRGLSEEERRGLLEMGITTVVDLRSRDECARAPHPLTGDGRFTLLQDSADDHAHVEPGKDFPRIYCDYERLSAVHYRTVLEAAAAAPGAVAFHCFSGKDRTGMVAALLLASVGALREDMLADYVVSSIYLDDLALHPIPSNPENLVSFLELNRFFGGPERFLTGRCALSPEAYRILKERLSAR